MTDTAGASITWGWKGSPRHLLSVETAEEALNALEALHEEALGREPQLVLVETALGRQFYVALGIAGKSLISMTGAPPYLTTRGQGEGRSEEATIAITCMGHYTEVESSHLIPCTLAKQQTHMLLMGRDPFDIGSWTEI